MKLAMWSTCLVLLAAAPVNAQIIKGVIPIKGAEMT